MSNIFNVNVGVLGHVDSGKTALVAALSDVLSVAALDKHPQSQERGITLDLGISAFQVPCPEHLKAGLGDADTVQFTLVDCPGHASLIKTVLLGAQIMDIMILVVDVVKGIQAQTAECIILGELLTSRMVVALNKTDLLPEEKRMKHLRRAGRAVLEALRLTRFADSELVPTAAKVAGEAGRHEGAEALKEALLFSMPRVTRLVDAPFLLMADHCFFVKGHGSVVTGTVLQGRLRVGDVVELPDCKEQRKVKSLQCFRRPVDAVAAGDRVGVCLTQVPTQHLERTFVCQPNLLSTFSACVCAVERCRFYSGRIPSRQKAHVTVAYQTRLAQAIFFGAPEGLGCSQVDLVAGMFNRVGKFAGVQPQFDAAAEYLYQDELHGVSGRPSDGGPLAPDGGVHYGPEWALLILAQPVLALPGSVMISTKLDLQLEQGEPACRIAFYGNVVHTFDSTHDHTALRLYRNKFREGRIDRLEGPSSVIVKDLFKKETDIGAFVGLPIVSACGRRGVLESRFGKSGKVRVSFPNGLPDIDTDRRVALQFKKYTFGPVAPGKAKAQA